jgi:hypothetical protein
MMTRMAQETRYCANCRVALPRGAESCPGCGTLPGQVFDGHKPRKKRRVPWMEILLLLVVAAAAVYWFGLRPPSMRFDSGPIHVVNRPGGARRAEGSAISEPEAIRLLRRQLATDVKSECLVVMSEGSKGTIYILMALNRCDGTNLGRWIVDGKTQRVWRE